MTTSAPKYAMGWSSCLEISQNITMLEDKIRLVTSYESISRLVMISKLIKKNKMYIDKINKTKSIDRGIIDFANHNLMRLQHLKEKRPNIKVDTKFSLKVCKFAQNNNIKQTNQKNK